jgi:SAM-dependent methyltransferase
MVRNFDEIRFKDLVRRPFFYKQLIKSTSNRYLHKFLSHVGSEDLILDVGSGAQSVIPPSYKKIEIDISPKHKPEIVGSAVEIPFKELSIDHICCSWVYEHVEEPAKVLLEFQRVLKPGGYLYLTANFVWHLHEEPRDFFRFTQYGLEYLFKKYGSWKTILMEPTAGFWLTVSQILNYKLTRLMRPFHPIATLPLQVLGLFLEKHDPDPSIAAGYCMIAQKVEEDML